MPRHLPLDGHVVFSAFKRGCITGLDAIVKLRRQFRDRGARALAAGDVWGWTRAGETWAAIGLGH